MRYTHEDIGDQRAEKRMGVAPGQITKALAVFYLIGALLNGEHLLQQAELMPYGLFRDACVAVVRPLAYVSNKIGFSAPRHGLENLLGQLSGE